MRTAPSASAEAAPPVHSVRVRALDLPLTRPTETAAGTLASAPLVLIDLQTADGALGRSYLRAYTPAALRALATLVEDVAELVRGRPADPALIRAQLAGEFALLGVRGLVGATLAGFDMALWDAAARRRDQSLAAMLGTSAHRVPAYTTIRSRRPDEACEDAELAVSQGFKALKLKLGRDDLQLVQAVRSAVGPAVKIMVDYNQSLSVEEALRLAPRLDELGLEWVEEPTVSADLPGHARIAAAMATRVQLGENWEGTAEVRSAIDARACDLVMLDAMRIGGVSGWLEAVAAAPAIPVSSHAFPEFSVHLLAASPGAHWLEHLDYLSAIATRPLSVVDGYAVVPDGPGAGLEWDEDALARLV